MKHASQWKAFVVPSADECNLPVVLPFHQIARFLSSHRRDTSTVGNVER